MAMLLGVHIMVHNEADLLGRCLSSVRGIADEVIVADTGSTDESAAIAASFGAKVISVPWKDDFSAVRNVMLAHAQTAWILVLDADEWLHGENLAMLREELARVQTPAVKLPMVHMIDETGTGNAITSEATRLFRNGLGIAFSGEIHEQLVRNGIDSQSEKAAKEADTETMRSQSGVIIFHDGYKPSILQSKKKAERNLRIIARQLSKRPNDPFCLYNYGVSLCQLGRVEEAAEAFRLSHSATPMKAPYRPALVRDYAKTLLACGLSAEAGQLLQGEAAGYPDYAELQLLYGESLLALGLLKEARQAFEHAAAAGGKDQGRYISQAGSGTYRAHSALADTYLRTGDTARARGHYEKALEAAPLWEPALQGLAELLKLEGAEDEAIADWLKGQVGDDNVLLAARVLGGIGAYACALPLWSKEEGRMRTERDQLLFAECLIGNGKGGEACANLCELVEGSNVYTDEVGAAVVDWFLCCWAEGRRMSAEGWSKLRLWMGRAQLEWAKELDAIISVSKSALPPPIAGERQLAAARVFMRRAIRLGMLPLAKRFAERVAGLKDAFETDLYDEGYTDAAAEWMLRSYEAEGRLAAEQAFRLGEILYEKRLYHAALPLLEQAASAETACAGRARLASASACLQLALEALQPEEYSGGRSWDGGWPAQDKDRLTAALNETEALGWFTRRDGLQRRRAGGKASEAHFLMHDR
ncbi:glycosyltransferase [Paenibacillus sp. NEAU-GSW1]|uniref:glycosyltransferase n=1 Tax=Paenibacillus sp. NEAU-GSW1 TaxID=2682486 RepID=UPI0012E0E8D0|nr:glycosyltransferase [Paenibacillus sp. NEAU-GSW1]MUT65141.1 glycosyltransferase [Paenibacillus sp. NEAU-GSW1]